MILVQLRPWVVLRRAGSVRQILGRALEINTAGYRKPDWSCVGESACANSWGRALITGEPSLSIPCFAERRYGGVMEDELSMALAPKYLPKIIEGPARLSANGLRHPIPQYGIQSDAAAGLGVSYSKR